MATFNLPDKLILNLGSDTKMSRVFGATMELDLAAIPEAIVARFVQTGVREILQDRIAKHKKDEGTLPVEETVESVVSAWHDGIFERETRSESMIPFVRDILKTKLALKAADLKGVTSWDTVEGFLELRGMDFDTRAKVISALMEKATEERARRTEAKAKLGEGLDSLI